MYVHHHLRKVHKACKCLEKSCKKREFEKFGEKVACIFHDIYKKEKEE